MAGWEGRALKRKLGSQGAEQEGVEGSRRLQVKVEAWVDRGVGFMCEKGQSPERGPNVSQVRGFLGGFR